MREFKTGLPELPDLDEYKTYLDKIWESSHITNFGVFECEFEKCLSEYFGGKHVVLFANGTSALEALLAVLDVRGTIHTTPFSFVATLNAIKRNKLKVDYVDVDSRDGTLDSEQLRQIIHSKTGVVLAVHPYGYSCDVDALGNVTDESGIPLIYDAAHTMGAKYKNVHLASYGLASVLSFHATKILSSVEGGAVVTDSKELAIELKSFRNFGRDHTGRTTRSEATNSKLSELHAAMGLLQLRHFDNTLKKRQYLLSVYNEKLAALGLCTVLQPRFGAQPNGSYVPLITNLDVEGRANLIAHLDAHSIYAKPYFDKPLSDFDECCDQKVIFKNAKYLSETLLCLPIHSKMTDLDVEYIVEKIGEYYVTITGADS